MAARAVIPRGLPWALLALGVVSIIGTAWTSLSALAFGLVWVGYFVVGLLVVRRQPHHRLGWLMLVVGSLSTLGVWGISVTEGPTVIGPPVAESVIRALTVWPWLAVCAIVTLFPDGYATTTYDRILVRVIGWGGCVLFLFVLVAPGPLDSGRLNPLGLSWLGLMSPAASGVGFLLIPVLLVVALVGVRQKWVASRGVVHSQYTCLLFGAAATAAGFALAFATDGTALGSVAWALSLAALPTSMGVAILRFRLYEIDRIVRRTTSYAVVTGLVVAVYVVVVTAATRLLPDSSSLAVAAATLTAAAVARPLLHRVQSAVDRRFNRTRYDAQRTVEAFGDSMRVVTEPHEVTGRLLETVQVGLQPVTVGLWQRDLP